MEEYGNIRWFVKGNQVSASLRHWAVSIDFCHNGKNLYFPLKVYKDGKELLKFNFYTYEDAISFTNHVVNKCWTTDEILEKYQEMFSEKKLKSLEEKVKNDKISLTPEEVDQAIIDYFGKEKEYPVSCKEELTMNKKGVDLAFYLIEHTREDGVRRDISTRLTKGDLMNALRAYIEFYGYELLDFKYIGGIHRAGYFIDEDTPHYDGIELKVKKIKNKALKLQRKDVDEQGY